MSLPCCLAAPVPFPPTFGVTCPTPSPRFHAGLPLRPVRSNHRPFRRLCTGTLVFKEFTQGPTCTLRLNLQALTRLISISRALVGPTSELKLPAGFSRELPVLLFPAPRGPFERGARSLLDPPLRAAPDTRVCRRASPARNFP